MKEEIIKLQKEIEQLKIENKEKDEAIIELSQFYYVSYFFNLIYLQYYQKQNPSEPLNEDNNDDDKII